MIWNVKTVGVACCALLAGLNTVSAQDDEQDLATLPPCPASTETSTSGVVTSTVEDISTVTITRYGDATGQPVIDKRQADEAITTNPSVSTTISDDPSVLPVISEPTSDPTSSFTCSPVPVEVTTVPSSTSIIKTPPRLITTTIVLSRVPGGGDPGRASASPPVGPPQPVNNSDEPPSPPKETPSPPVQPTGSPSLPGGSSPAQPQPNPSGGQPGAPPSLPGNSAPAQPAPKQSDGQQSPPTNNGVPGQPQTAQPGNSAPSGPPGQPGATQGTPAPQNTNAQDVPQPVPTPDDSPDDDSPGAPGESVTVISTGIDGKPTPVVVAPPDDSTPVTVISTGADGNPTPIVVSPPSDSPDDTTTGGVPGASPTTSGQQVEFTGVANHNAVGVQTSLLAALVGLAFLRF